MQVITYQNAQDEVFGIVKAVLDANQLAFFDNDNTKVFDVRYPGVTKNYKPDPTQLWMRVSSQIVTDEQSALGNSGGVKRYEAIALLYVQLFAPRNIGSSNDKAVALAELIRSEFRKASPSGNIWFLNQKVVELPETETSYPTNVVVEYRYHTEQ